MQCKIEVHNLVRYCIGLTYFSETFTSFSEALERDWPDIKEQEINK